MRDRSPRTFGRFAPTTGRAQSADTARRAVYAGRRNDLLRVSLASWDCSKKGNENEKASTSFGCDGSARSLRDHSAAAADADLRGRLADPRGSALPASSTAPTASAASADGLPGWNVGAGRLDLPDPAAAPAVAEALGRTRLISA